MKKAYRLIAMLLTVVILATSLMSCDLIGELLGSNEAPPTPEAKPNHTHSYTNGKCSCGKSDPNYKAPHEHIFVEGKCHYSACK